MPRKSKTTGEEEAATETATDAIPEKVLTLKLLKNYFVRGVLYKAGKTFTFPELEAKRRLAKTDGVWTSV